MKTDTITKTAIASLIIAQSADAFSSLAPSTQSFQRSSGDSNPLGRSARESSELQAWKFLDGLEDFQEKIKPSSREKFSEKQLQGMIDKGDFDAVAKAYKKGANPELKFDIKGEGGQVVSSDNTMLHALANELNNKEGLEGRIMPLMTAVEQYATSGGRLDAVNSVGKNVTQIVDESGPDDQYRDYRSLVNHKVKNLQEQQKSVFYQDERTGYLYVGPEEFASYDNPDKQALNLFSQTFSKMSDDAKERAVSLAQSGVDLDKRVKDMAQESEYSIDRNIDRQDSRTLRKVAEQNWGKDKVKQFERMSKIAERIDSLEGYDEKKITRGKVDEQLSAIEEKGRESALSKEFSKVAEQFMEAEKDKSQGLFR